MTKLRAPGIHMEEVATGPRPIESVGTSIVAAIGVAPAADQRVLQIVPITNMSEFRRIFVDPAISDDELPASTDLAKAIDGFYQNGDGLCMVVNLGPGSGIVELRAALTQMEARDEVSLVIAPGMSDHASHVAVLDHCLKMQDRFAILDPSGKVDDVKALTLVAATPIDDADAPPPPPRSRATKKSTASIATDKDEGDADSDPAQADDESPPSTPPLGSPAASGAVRPPLSTYGAFYYPRIYINDPLDGSVTVAPPSGHLAGVYARVDQRRGVHKAPANEGIAGALNLEDFINKHQQAQLNTAGVNIIRTFPRQGIRIWGARTLAEAADEYRYINVRRLIIMIKESIEAGTNWIVFEPNDFQLWSLIRRDVTAFLTRVWRDGALLGRTPSEAFFVRCDRETNPDENIDAGEVTIEIGLAPVKPAEFVVFKVSQSVGTGTEQGA